ncbi:TetR/AcrR family transcriptional regulator [Streptomyces misionensis]|uniref:TetR/AcrR family transcriptional regulator n=1 Tax=Streptomyces misionensis TaxID=67331 RepID=A0A5C6JB74_9ACTN|nr:TetR/AcrR family transcriptional regulator [Streptomyces misionensis]TWV37767.1 TetR/AcrR family transcriptional regulator [Streptomyces misionensis]
MAKSAGRTARDSVWLREKPRRGGRTGQPSGLDRERITAVSVRLLDAEGLARFSMRRLAAELNVTAMSLYWYVDTKDDLFELALDAAFGELRLPGEDDAADWREQLRALAAEYRGLLVRHPWLSRLAGQYLNIGPRALDFSRTVQHVIGRSGLPAHRVMSAISAVFQFVYGYGTTEAQFMSRIAATGLSPDDYREQALDSVRQDPGIARFLQDSARIMDARGEGTVAELMDRDFTFALDLLIAGIEAMVERG